MPNTDVIKCMEAWGIISTWGIIYLKYDKLQTFR